MTKKLLFSLFLAAATLAAEPRLLFHKKIWDAGPHNAFTDLIHHENEFFCVFREAADHVSPDGKIRVVSSKDGTNWTSAALISKDARDLRDPKITLTPDGRLMIYAATADRPNNPVTHQSLALFSKDGYDWSAPVDIADKNIWLWRLAWNPATKTALGIGYDTTAEKLIRLYQTKDGQSYQAILENLFDQERPNESGIVYEPDNTALCLLRRDGNPGHGLLGISKPPYTTWEWKDVGAKIGGPQLIRLPDARLIGAVRLYDGGARTSLIQIDRETGRLTELLKLPSGGDCSYPGLVWHENQLWISYYSSHEGKTSIYIARAQLQ